MNNLSFWEKTSFLAPVDFVIIGSGITGLNVALLLRERYPKSSVSVFERGTLPSGASTKNAGFACFGSISELLSDLENEDENVVKERVALRYFGIQRLKASFESGVIDYEPTGNFELFRSPTEFNRCVDHIERFNDWMYEIDKIRPFSVDHHGSRLLIKNEAEGVIHSGKLVQQLILRCQSKGIQIFTNVEINQVAENHLSTSIGNIAFEKCIVATNGFTQKLLPEIKIKPARGYVFVSQPINGFDWIGGFHVDEGYIYFRHVDQNRLLIGGARNIDPTTEETTSIDINQKIKRHLLSFVENQLQLKNIEIAHEWVGFMGFTDKKSPVIKQINASTYIAAGLSGIGVATGFSAAEKVVSLLEQSA